MTPKRINLALQGGGAHGAFTWGVLDRILAEESIEIAAISGTSAGALNGAAVKSGLIEGGRDRARANLVWLWEQMGAIEEPHLAGWMSMAAPDPAEMSRLLSLSPAYGAADAASRMISPYAWGPFYRNPVRRIAEHFAYDRVCAPDGPEFHVCATNVRTGRIRVFTGEDIRPEVIEASACLPTIFKAVEVTELETGEVEAYWDGGYTGNPALFPLFARHLPDDIVIVNINPIERDRVPKTAQEIQNRINEISFNSSLLRELRAIDFVRRLIAQGAVPRGTMKEVLVHMISDDALMNELSVATKMLPSATVIHALKQAGESAADRFLADNHAALNDHTSLDLRAMFA